MMRWTISVQVVIMSAVSFTSELSAFSSHSPSVSSVWRHYKQPWTVPELGLTPRLKSLLPSSGLLHGVRWFETDVSGLHIFPIFKSQVSGLLLWFESDVSGLNIGFIFKRPTSGLLRGVRWFETDVSGIPIIPSARVRLRDYYAV
jgi:hypothetical protein